MAKQYAMVFPGQGSQSVGMMTGMQELSTTVKTLFDQASEALGYNLWDLVSDGPESELNQTEKTQPALLTAGIATWQVWQQQCDTAPDMVAGHSLGEYTALVAAGVMAFEDAVKLVSLRGKCMQQAVPGGVGAMAAVLGLDDDKVEQVCQDAAQDQVVSAANFNSPGQVVIAGHKEAVERAIDAAKAAGSKRAILLPVSVPSHCMLMKAAADEFATHLDTITLNEAAIPVIQNVDAGIKTDPAQLKQGLLEQLYKPVRWVDVVHEIQGKGIQSIIECGPGKVLSGLNKRIERSIDVHCIQDEQSLQKALAS